MGRIATVVKGYPRLSETFILQEIHGLEARGVAQVIVSLRHPTDAARHAITAGIKADVLYLPEYLKDDRKRVRRSLGIAEGLPGYGAARAAFERDLARDRSVNRRRRFGQAAVLAAELPDDVDLIYAHFLHTPASVARYAAMMRELPWSFSAHAKDIWTTPDWEVREKIADAAFGVTCTRAGLDRLRALAARPDKVELVYHGLDFDALPIRPHRPAKDGPATIVSVGRAVEKKGYGDLLAALGRLREDPRWRFEHIGGGPLTDRLEDRAARLGLADRIVWHGAEDREAVFALLARADLFVLPSRVARSGDRDGLPNVLMEAQAAGVATLATDVSGIPELIEDGRTGVLVPERRPDRLAEAIGALLDDPARRRALAKAGAEHVRARFAAAPGLDRIAALIAAHRSEPR